MRENCEVRINGCSMYLPELWEPNDQVCEKPSVGTLALHNNGNPRNIHVCAEHYDAWMKAGDEIG